MASLMASSLSGMELKRAFVVHGLNGWDEPTPASKFELFDVKKNTITHRIIDPVSLNSEHFASRFNLTPLGVHSGITGARLTGNISSTTLTPGDVVLVQGTNEAIGNLKSNSNMLVIA